MTAVATDAPAARARPPSQDPVHPASRRRGGGERQRLQRRHAGRENLLLVARLRHVADPSAIADGLLARFALTDASARRVATYSGGMRRRLDIAMSLIGNPAIIFLDEAEQLADRIAIACRCAQQVREIMPDPDV